MYKLKLPLYLCMLLIIMNTAHAQDTIYFRDGSLVIAKVFTITSTELRYSKFNNSDGPVYQDSINKITTVHYKGGSVDSFSIKKAIVPSVVVATPKKLEIEGYKYWLGGRHLSERELHQLLLTSNDPKIQSLVKDAKRQQKLQKLGFITIPTGVLAYGFFMAAFFKSLEHGTSVDEKVYTGVGVGCATISSTFLISSFTCKFKRKNATRAAAVLYRNQN